MNRPCWCHPHRVPYRVASGLKRDSLLGRLPTRQLPAELAALSTVSRSRLKGLKGTQLNSRRVSAFIACLRAGQAATVRHPAHRQRRSPPHVSTRFIAPSETFVNWLNAIRVILLNYDFMIFRIGIAC
jgi:hypothetical protein